jgi:hypothetical protein
MILWLARVLIRCIRGWLRCLRSLRLWLCRHFAGLSFSFFACCFLLSLLLGDCFKREDFIRHSLPETLEADRLDKIGQRRFPPLLALVCQLQ